MHKFLMTTAATVLTLGLSAGLAQAETYDGESKGMGTNANQVYGISDGNAVVKTQTNYDSFEVAAGHPLEGQRARVSVPCWLMGQRFQAPGIACSIPPRAIRR